MNVEFTDAGEFLAEIGLDRGRVEREIVRVTKSFRHASYHVMTVELVATAVMNDGDDAPGRIVRLHRHVGNVTDVRKPTEPDLKVLQQADQIADEITRTVEEMGMTVRAGIYRE